MFFIKNLNLWTGKGNVDCLGALVPGPENAFVSCVIMQTYMTLKAMRVKLKSGPWRNKNLSPIVLKITKISHFRGQLNFSRSNARRLLFLFSFVFIIFLYLAVNFDSVQVYSFSATISVMWQKILTVRFLNKLITLTEAKILEILSQLKAQV